MRYDVFLPLKGSFKLDFIFLLFADFISFFSKYPMKMKDKLFHFHRIFKHEGWGGGSSEPPEPHLDPPLM